MSNAYESIKLERAEQDKKWGGSSHDDQHSTYDWIVFIVKHLGRAIVWNSPNILMQTFRYQMVRVGALAVAAIEWVDRSGPANNQLNLLEKE